jgi:hypothetical protein
MTQLFLIDCVDSVVHKIVSNLKGRDTDKILVPEFRCHHARSLVRYWLALSSGTWFEVVQYAKHVEFIFRPWYVFSQVDEYGDIRSLTRWIKDEIRQVLVFWTVLIRDEGMCAMLKISSV